MDIKKYENEIKDKIREGALFKRSKFLKEWRQRWIVITPNTLLTYTNRQYKQLTEAIDLKDIKSYKSYLRKDEEMIPSGFKIRSVDSELYLCARNCSEKWSWIVTFERVLDFKYNGSSNYNSAQFIKTKGFSSQLDFQKIKDETELTLNQKQSSKSSKDQENQLIRKQQLLTKREEQCFQREKEIEREQKKQQEQWQKIKEQKKKLIKQIRSSKEEQKNNFQIPTSSQKKEALKNQPKDKEEEIASVSKLKDIYEKKMEELNPNIKATEN